MENVSHTNGRDPTKPSVSNEDAPSTLDVENQISHSKIRIKTQSPFFGTLCYFAQTIVTDRVPTAATDGKNLFFNPRYIADLSERELDGLLLHELLHAALQHVSRRRERDDVLWNVAADIVVNGIVAQQDGIVLPPHPVREEDLEDHAVEEVYVLLSNEPAYQHLRDLADAWRDLLKPPQGAAGGTGIDLERHWRQALRQAGAMQRRSGNGHGSLPDGMERHMGDVLEPQMDWRALLWRYLVRAPFDFDRLDRRFVHRKLYLEALDADTLDVAICIDTSGSISEQVLDQFLGEVRGILRSYPHLQARLYYADADLYGPFPVTTEEIPTPVGGGGTSFIPFFETIDDAPTDLVKPTPVLVYLTDGYGAFPSERPPQADVIWVVTPGGLQSEAFPFGTVVRMVE